MIAAVVGIIIKNRKMRKGVIKKEEKKKDSNCVGSTLFKGKKYTN